MRIILKSVTRYNDGVREEKILSTFYSFSRKSDDECLGRARRRADFLASSRDSTNTYYCLEIIEPCDRVRFEIYPNWAINRGIYHE